MPSDSTLLSSDQVLACLPEDVRRRYADAEHSCREAVTLFDFGIGRGLLLALLKDNRIDQLQFNSLFDRMTRAVPKSIIESIPPEYRANYGRGIIVPAAISTRAAQRD
jgi:hypothetical protein